MSRKVSLDWFPKELVSELQESFRGFTTNEAYRYGVVFFSLDRDRMWSFFKAKGVYFMKYVNSNGTSYVRSAKSDYQLKALSHEMISNYQLLH